MDRLLQEAWRQYSSEPTLENATRIRLVLRRLGSPLGINLVFDCHLAANKILAGDTMPFDHSPRLEKARRSYSIHLLLAGAVYSGLELSDLEIILLHLGYRVPRVIYSPSGFELLDIVDNWNDCGGVYGNHEEFILVSDDEDSEVADRLTHYCQSQFEDGSVVIDDIGLQEDIVTNNQFIEGVLGQWEVHGGLGGAMGNSPSRQDLTSATGHSFAQLAWEYTRYTACETEAIIHSRTEFKRRYALWLAMEAQSWL